MIKERGKHLRGASKNSVCILCEKLGARGRAVKEDYLIAAIRAVKRLFKMEAGNKLVVCDECYPAYSKKRGEFEKGLLIYGIIGMAIMLLLLIMSFSLGSLISGLLMLLFLLILAHIKYTPKVEG
ncbi:MAG: hypothetical protein QXU54_01815 [Candidatus Micrarchaeia archaeon]